MGRMLVQLAKKETNTFPSDVGMFIVCSAKSQKNNNSVETVLGRSLV